MYYQYVGGVSVMESNSVELDCTLVDAGLAADLSR